MKIYQFYSPDIAPQQSTMHKDSTNLENKIKFTEARIKELPLPPEGQRFVFHDIVTPSLTCRVTASGVKTFNLYYWSKTLARPLRVSLGRWPSLSVEKAREQASIELSEVIKGKNPISLRRAIRDELTLGVAIDNYLEWLRGQERKVTTITTYLYFSERFLSMWKAKRLDSINTELVISLRAKIRDKDGALAKPSETKRNEKADRRVTANRVLRFLSQVFNHALNHGWKGVNPCRSVKPFPEKPTTRRLEDNEIGPFLDSCASLRVKGDKNVDYLSMCLFTGVRRRNVAAARWEDISLEFNVWNIPDTKNNLPQKVYLSPPVKDLLMRRRVIGSNSQYVFPSSSSSGHFQEPVKLLKRVLKLAKINSDGLTIHALKHTFVSLAYEAGINPIVVSCMGGHKVSGITARYGHASERSVRDGYVRVAEYIFGVTAQKNNVQEVQNG